MKKLILIGAFMFASQLVYTQTNGLGKWLVSVNFGIEEHDKRLFDYPEREILLEMQPEFWGTYHLGVDLNRKFWQGKRFSSFIGLGLSYESASFLRPFDDRYFATGVSQDILRNLNRYRKMQCPISVSTLFQVGKNFHMTGAFSSNILLHRNIEHTENGSFHYKKNTFEIDGISLNIGIIYKINNLIIGLDWRGLRYQRIDEIIFNEIVKDTRTDQSWEWNNPLRFDLVVGYTFGE